MAWVTYGSPLYHRDSVQTGIKPLPSRTEKIRLEKLFVNDAVQTCMFHYPRRKPIIPPYNALQDKYARHYFMSPTAKAIAIREKFRQEVKDLEQTRKNLNKLSSRHRCRKSPVANELLEREDQFVNDAIITERRRTKYKDIIPKYDAAHDQHCQGYIQRLDVQRLIATTCSPRPLPSPRR
ncbi:uncharacterized protein LOC121385090 [Gigantopelta aegis]|uniref:uncharacterized protein LOC121385090 n=1 Tax=Gigantopelta aegis TaxID=1735272 RepID=UPI001B88D1F4|nr:uncharacterized protein LOC121385090 [Gigantopelta aegis]